MADWFLKADDDTYVIVENLRYFLSRQNTTNPVYFGHKFKRHVKEGYMSGGAGYVLSKEALDRCDGVLIALLLLIIFCILACQPDHPCSK